MPGAAERFEKRTSGEKAWRTGRTARERPKASCQTRPISRDSLGDASHASAAFSFVGVLQRRKLRARLINVGERSVPLAILIAG